jgi:hypothetical protein
VCVRGKGGVRLAGTQPLIPYMPIFGSCQTEGMKKTLNAFDGKCQGHWNQSNDSNNFAKYL